MPIIFVILDEFSIMSQVLSESDSYKRKLQNILAKGRSSGIKFIFQVSHLKRVYRDLLRLQKNRYSQELQ